jgi:CRP/FNR family transcriptional regulator
MLGQEDVLWLQRMLPFYSELNEEEKNLLLSNTSSLHYTKGTVVHGGQADCIGLLMIKHGSLRTYILSEEGRDITLFRQHEGELCILSASCIIKQITFDVHIEAETDCDVLLVSASTISRLTADNPVVESFSLQLTAERFSEVMWTMQQILFMGYDKRLAVFLVDEAAKTGSSRLQVTHEQIAKYTGSAREVVTRMLKHFSDDGLVRLSRGEVEIVDKARLRALI